MTLAPGPLDGPPGLTYATVIGARAVEGRWKAWLARELHSRGIAIHDERLRVDGELIGFARLVDVEDARVWYGEASWMQPSASPWVGPPAGVIGWTHSVDDHVARERLLQALIELGRGPFVRRVTERDEVLESFVRRRFSLANLVQRHGFDDGAALLRNDAEYMTAAVAIAQEALRAAGYVADVGTWPSDNPLRISGPVWRDGRALDDAERELAAHGFDLWAYDWSILREPTFWFE